MNTDDTKQPAAQPALDPARYLAGAALAVLAAALAGCASPVEPPTPGLTPGAQGFSISKQTFSAAVTGNVSLCTGMKSGPVGACGGPGVPPTIAVPAMRKPDPRVVWVVCGVEGATGDMLPCVAIIDPVATQ